MDKREQERERELQDAARALGMATHKFLAGQYAATRIDDAVRHWIGLRAWHASADVSSQRITDTDA